MTDAIRKKNEDGKDSQCIEQQLASLIKRLKDQNWQLKLILHDIKAESLLKR
jgi:hypothetical protein